MMAHSLPRAHCVLDVRDLDLDFVSYLCGANNTVDNRLIDKNLGGGDGGGASGLHSIQERANLTIEKFIERIGQNGQYSFHGLSRDFMVESHGPAHASVPTLCGGNT